MELAKKERVVFRSKKPGSSLQQGLYPSGCMNLRGEEELGGVGRVIKIHH
jgi:hypothetical protein